LQSHRNLTVSISITNTAAGTWYWRDWSACVLWSCERTDSRSFSVASS